MCHIRCADDRDCNSAFRHRERVGRCRNQAPTNSLVRTRAFLQARRSASIDAARPSRPWHGDVGRRHWFAVGLSDGWAEIVPTSATGEPKRWKADSRRIDAIQFLADGDSIVVAGADKPGGIWDVTGTPKLRASLHSDFAGLTACAVSPDGKLLATADGDTVLRIYDTSTWKMVHEYRGFKLETFAVPFTSDGKYLLAGGADDHISVLDLSLGREVHRLRGETGVVGDIVPMGDNRRAAALYFDGNGLKPPHQVVWNLDTFKAEPLTAEHPLTGGGLVRGKLWIASANGRSLQVWEYE